jgi:hypothetical protein
MGDLPEKQLDIDPDTVFRIEEALRNWRQDPEMRRQMEQTRAKWDERIRPMIEAIRQSERLTAEDYAIRVY